MSTPRNSTVVRGLVTFALVITAVWASPPLADDGADSLAVRKAIEEENRNWYAGDSIYPADIENEVIDSLLPVFVPFGEGEKLVFKVEYGITIVPPKSI